MNSAQVAELRHIESTIGLEEYMNAVLVLKGARKAMLLEANDYWTSPDPVRTMNKVVEEIHRHFSTLHVYPLKNAYLISKYPYTLNDIRGHRRLGRVLGYPCANEFKFIDSHPEYDTWILEIIAHVKGYRTESVQLFVNLCLTPESLKTMENMAARFNNVFQADPLLKNIVQDVRAIAKKQSESMVGGRAENSQENVGMNDELSQQLFEAAMFGNLAEVQELLGRPDVNVNHRDNRPPPGGTGNTPLGEAAFRGLTPIVQALLTHPGINVNRGDRDGITPLNQAATPLIAQLLRDAGAGGIALAIPYLPPPPPIAVVNPMIGKVNQGVLEIVPDKRANSISLTDIQDGEEVVRIRQGGHDFFHHLEDWMEYVNHAMANHKHVENPVTRARVLPEQIDIFTARVVGGSKRRKVNSRRAHRVRRTRRARKTRKTHRRRSNH